MTKELEEIKNLLGKVATKRDISSLQVIFDEKTKKLQRQISDMNNLLKNLLIDISKKSQQDDLSDVMAQLDLIDKKKEE